MDSHIDRTRAKRLLPLIQAFVDGKEIEWCHYGIATKDRIWELVNGELDISGNICLRIRKG